MARIEDILKRLRILDSDQSRTILARRFGQAFADNLHTDAKLLLEIGQRAKALRAIEKEFVEAKKAGEIGESEFNYFSSTRRRAMDAMDKALDGVFGVDGGDEEDGEAMGIRVDDAAVSGEACPGAGG